MNAKILFAAILVASCAQGKEPKRYQTGTLQQMDSVECGVDENSGKSFVGEVVGTDSAHKKTHALLCQEYILQSDKIIYRIRPRDEKEDSFRRMCKGRAQRADERTDLYAYPTCYGHGGGRVEPRADGRRRRPRRGAISFGHHRRPEL